MNMKKIISWGMMLAAAFTLTNCAKEIDAPVQEPESVGYPFEIVASTVDTKTVNDGMSTKWADGDKINVFYALGETADYVDNGAFTVEDVEEGRFTGTLKEQLSVEEEYDWYVLYPYNDKVTTPGAKTAGYTYIGYSTGLNQTGYNSMASLKGSVCPLYGTAKYAGVRPEITMNHLSSIIAINVTNQNEEPLTITTASFTAPEDIVGSYFIDITGESVVYTPSDANYVKNTAVVNVTSGATALAQGESAILYAAIKPFTAAAGQKLTLSVNGYSKDITIPNDKNVTFTAGKIKTLNFAYDKVEEPEDEVVETYTWDLTKASYSAASASEVAWTSDYADMVLAKGKSSTNANNYLGGTYAHTRVYKDQVLTLTAADAVIIKKVEFNVVSNYMDEFEGATWSNATKSVSGLVMTVTPNDELQPMSVTIGSATRFTSVKVYYELDPDYVAPTLVSIKVENPKTEYYVGDEFETPKVVAVFDNEKEYEVNEGVTFSGFDSSDVAEEQEITVTYSGLTTSYTISIIEAPVIGEDPVPSGTVLWAETWADAGVNTTTFANNSAISTYTYAGRSGYGDNATSVTYTADASNNVRITKSSGGNCTSGHLWFNKSVAGELKTSAIKLYGATSLSFSHSQGTSGSSCQTLYSVDGGSTWTSLGTQSGAIATKTYNFTVPEGTESIMIKLAHASSNKNNTRVDNLVLKVN